MPSTTRRRKRASLHIRTTKRLRSSQRIMSPLRSSYGYIILPKGMHLYNVGIKSRCELPKKTIIFTTYHPSEWYFDDAFVSVIELQRDVELLFMIDIIRNMRIYSALNSLLDKNNSNLMKMKSDNCTMWTQYLQEENLDGWFTTIENKSPVEFAIHNDPSILKLISCEPLQRNWTNSYYSRKNGMLIPKDWGTIYPVYTEKSIQFIIPKRYEIMLETYKTQVQEQDTNGTALYLLLKNGKITYTNEPFTKIQWNYICDI